MASVWGKIGQTFKGLAPDTLNPFEGEKKKDDFDSSGIDPVWAAVGAGLDKKRAEELVKRARAEGISEDILKGYRVNDWKAADRAEEMGIMLDVSWKDHLDMYDQYYDHMQNAKDTEGNSVYDLIGVSSRDLWGSFVEGAKTAGTDLGGFAKELQLGGQVSGAPEAIDVGGEGLGGTSTGEPDADLLAYQTAFGLENIEQAGVIMDAILGGGDVGGLLSAFGVGPERGISPYEQATLDFQQQQADREYQLSLAGMPAENWIQQWGLSQEGDTSQQQVDAQPSAAAPAPQWLSNITPGLNTGQAIQKGQTPTTLNVGDWGKMTSAQQQGLTGYLNWSQPGSAQGYKQKMQHLAPPGGVGWR